ncbi:MAG: SGNH/GDSL hydrolase family protein [Planctomycetota bacterium]
MSHNAPLDRRDLLGASLAAAAGLSLTGCAALAAGPKTTDKSTAQSLIAPGDTVLFQGDSITDAGRSREHAGDANTLAALGGGYAWLAAAGLLVSYKGENLRSFNRGISGHKVFQLAERWQRDCLDLAPNVVSILIGVNDIWHSKGGGYAGTVAIYERDYDALLARTHAALPNVKLVVCEPFVLRCGAVDASWFPEFDEYRAAAKRVAAKHRATWVAFQSMFDEAVGYAPPEHWAKDGVHPSPSGAALMAQTWLDAVRAVQPVRAG